MITVTVRITVDAPDTMTGYRELSIEPGTKEAVQAWYKAGFRVPALKAIQAIHGLGLKDAKDLCDYLAGVA